MNTRTPKVRVGVVLGGYEVIGRREKVAGHHEYWWAVECQSCRRVYKRRQSQLCHDTGAGCRKCAAKRRAAAAHAPIAEPALALMPPAAEIPPDVVETLPPIAEIPPPLAELTAAAAEAKFREFIGIVETFGASVNSALDAAGAKFRADMERWIGV